MWQRSRNLGLTPRQSGSKERAGPGPSARTGLHLCRASNRSKIAFQKAIEIDRIIPAGIELDLPFHAAEDYLATVGGRWSELGDRLAMARDDHLLPRLDGAD